MSILSSQLLSQVIKDLTHQGDATPIHSVQQISGGYINYAVRLETSYRTYFMKWNFHSLPDMFESEAHGLSLLASTHTVRVPHVISFSEATTDWPAYILLEWLEGTSNDDQAQLGEQLAEMHHQSGKLQGASVFGLNHDNYIGSTVQINKHHSEWPAFFIENRIHPLVLLAKDKGYLNSERLKRIDQLEEKIPTLIHHPNTIPSLIHGDLWIGNVQNSQNGLALIDPAVSFSDREAEIAYTELFGGFNSRFYAAYKATWPLDTGYSNRRDIYNLYHLLNHLIIFGEFYGERIDLILRHYT